MVTDGVCGSYNNTHVCRAISRASFVGITKILTRLPWDWISVVKETRVFDALEWLAAMCSPVPNKGKQMVRYYGFCNNAVRGKWKKAAADNYVPCILEPELTDKDFRLR
ncbi:MAG: hypothetical protein H8E81_07845 [Deltaproteobacteria bacterium]|nr:hypothetical protein [Deltaproteobacteria bacterium]